MTNTIVAGNAFGDVERHLHRRETTWSAATRNWPRWATTAGRPPPCPSLPGSPAIGGGDDRGRHPDDRPARLQPRGAGVDIGAFQSEAAWSRSTSRPTGPAPARPAQPPPGGQPRQRAVRAETIGFDSSAFAGPQTITLAAGTLTLTDTGGPPRSSAPEAGKLTINGNGAGSVFEIEWRYGDALGADGQRRQRRLRRRAVQQERHADARQRHGQRQLPPAATAAACSTGWTAR